MSNHPSVIDLDINEISTLLITQGEEGVEGAVSLIDECLSSIGPIANVLVQNAMSFEDRVEQYELPRNYTGSILRNKKIADKVKVLGTEILSDRGLLGDEGFTNPLLTPIAGVLSNPNRVIHNFTLLSEYTRAEFVARLAERIGHEKAERDVPVFPPNGISFPVTTYAASIVSTEHGGVVIAPNDYNSMLFDFQLIPPMPVSGFIKDLVIAADEVTQERTPRTAVYSVKIPGGNPINAAAFRDRDGNWSVPFSTPEDDIDYVPLTDEKGDVLTDKVVVARNKTDLMEASSQRDAVSLPNLESAGDYLARISTVLLAKRNTADQPAS